MLYEFAVEPEVLVGWDKCRNVLNLMGFRHARAISAYPTSKQWKRMVLDACRNAGLHDVEFKRIHEKIRQVDAKLIRSTRPYDATLNPESERWLRNAVAQQNTSDPFHAILATRNPGARPDVVVETEIDEANLRLTVPRECPVLRQADQLSRHIRTLVRNSRRLLLVDPHFDPSAYRWRPVIAGCLALALDRIDGSPLDRIEIHSLDEDAKCTFEEFERRCRNRLPDWRPKGAGPVRLVRWRVRVGAPDDFHGRYVLTERGGYRVDKGLDEEYGKEQPVALLDDSEHARIWSGYQEGTPFFEKDGEVTLP